MGKVLHSFQNGYAGAISRSIDDIVISLRNASGGEVAFGAPLFHVSGENACRSFNASTSTSDNFVGFAVRVPDKTPENYGLSTGSYKANEIMDVLVRGSVVLPFESSALPGASVYVRKADGKLVVNPGAEGTTILLPNVTVRTARDTARCAEVVVSKRNLF